MAIRYMVMPLTVADNRRGPKYLKWPDNPSGMDVRWGLFDIGLLPQAIVAADVTTAQVTTLSANVDVTMVPANIDNTITALVLPAVRDALENIRIPGTWITAGTTTYRELLRMVCGLAQFAQRFHGMFNQYLIPDEINLNQTWGDLPDTWRQNLRACADSFQYDYSQVSLSTTIRVILKSLGDQWGDTPFYFGVATL